MGECDSHCQQTLSPWPCLLGSSHIASWRPVWRECQVSSLEIQWICHHPRAAHPTCSPWCQWGHQGCNFSSCMPSRHWLTRGWDGRVMSLCTAAWIRTQACLVAKALWWWCHVGWTLGLALLLGVQTIGLDQKRLQTHNLMCMSVPHICYTHVLYTNNDTEKIVEVRAWFELTALSTHLWLLSALTAHNACNTHMHTNTHACNTATHMHANHTNTYTFTHMHTQTHMQVICATHCVLYKMRKLSNHKPKMLFGIVPNKKKWHSSDWHSC